MESLFDWSWTDVRTLLHTPIVQWQLAILASGGLLAFGFGPWLQKQLQPAVHPKAVSDGLRRTAMRTGMLATVPLILWLWLLVGSTVLRHWKKVPTEILHYGILLAGALTMIRMGVFVLRHSFSPGSKLKAWEGLLTFTIWGIVALHILGWLPTVTDALDEYAISFGSVRLSLFTVTSFVLSMALLLLLALWLANAVQARIMRSELFDLTAKVALAKLANFLLVTAAIFVAILTAGIDLTTLTVFGGALGVGLGLGLQRTVSSFVSGFILVFENSVRPGDIIAVGNTYGKVQSLNARYVVVRTGDGLDILIPNEELTSAQITNWSYQDRQIRVRLPIQISYDDEPEAALTILDRVARAHPRVLKEPAPELNLLEFADSGINLELGIWIGDPEQGVKDVRTELYLQIWREFKAAGITIPFPQREVRIVDPGAEAARRYVGT
jgi:small-conductance mechanosensitive channel